MGFERVRLIALPVAVLLRSALVVLLLALGEADGHFDVVFAPVELECDERVALALDEARQAIDLAPVQQHLADALGLGDIVSRDGVEWCDVRVEQPRFALAKNYIAIGELRFAGAHAFDFPALQREAAFDAVLDEVVEARLLVLRDRALARLLFLGHGCAMILESPKKENGSFAHSTAQRACSVHDGADVRSRQRRRALSGVLALVPRRARRSRSGQHDRSDARHRSARLPPKLSDAQHAAAPRAHRHRSRVRTVPALARRVALRS